MDVNELQATISTLKMVIGVLVVIIMFLLVYAGALKSKLNALRGDNGELIKRLKIISRGKVID